MPAEDDPYLSVRDDVQSNLEQLNLLIESYRRITKTSSPQSAEASQTIEDIDGLIEDIRSDIKDLEDSIAAASKSPERYGITLEELDRRRQFVSATQQKLKTIQTSLRPTAPAEQHEAELNHDEQEEEQYQAQIMAEQDTQLDSVFHTVGNLRQQASTMGRELHEQSEILQEFEMAVDKSSDRLKQGMSQITDFLKRNEERGSTCCIAILIIILIILLVMVVLI